MGLEKIGLQAVFETNDFKKGVETYMKKLGMSEQATAKFAEAAVRIGTAAAPFAIVTAGVIGAAKAFQELEKAVQPTVDRAKDVRDLARAIGSTAEEASMLIEAADDMGISFESLQTAMLGAVRKGVDPSIDSIARLSDEYLTLAPGLERTKFLMDNFGRSGAEMGALMEQGAKNIRELGLSARQMGITFSTQGVKSAREYEIAIDNMNDAMMGVKQSIHMALLPAMTDVANATARFFAQQEVYTEQVKNGAMPALSAGANNLNIAMQELEQEADAFKMTQYNEQLAAAKEATDLAYDSNEEYILGLAGIATDAANAGIALEGVAVAIGHLSQAEIAKQTLDALNQALADGTITQADYEDALYTVGTSMMGLSDAEITAAIRAKELSMAFVQGGINVDNFTSSMQSLGQDVETTNRLQEALKNSLSDYNDVMREAPQFQYEAAQSIEAARQALELQNETILNTRPEMQEFGETLMGTGDAADMAARSIGGTTSAIDSLYNKRVDVRVHFRATGDVWLAGMGYTPSTSTGGAVGQTEQYVLENFAQGGNVQAGVPSIVGDMGRPEVFVPSSNGYIYPSPESFEGGIANAVASAMRGVMAQMSTKNYNLSVNTVQSSGAVVQDFEMMRLLS